MQGACFELTTLPRTISGTAPRPCFAALSRVQRTCADLPQNQADSRCRPNAATLTAVHKKVQGRPCSDRGMRSKWEESSKDSNAEGIQTGRTTWWSPAGNAQ